MSSIVIKAVLPKRFNRSTIEKELESAAKKAANDILLYFEHYVWNWEHKVKFKKLIAVERRQVEILVGTDDKIFTYVDEGTAGKGRGRKYPIPKKPKKKGYLAFPSVSVPKTQPGQLVSGPGYKGGPTVFAKQVMHPGIKPRNFSKNVKKIWDKQLTKNLQQALDRAAHKTGYSTRS